MMASLISSKLTKFLAQYYDTRLHYIAYKIKEKYLRYLQEDYFVRGKASSDSLDIIPIIMIPAL